MQKLRKFRPGYCGFGSSFWAVEGDSLIDAMAQFADVCIYDQAGYGWSSNSPNPCNSAEMMQDLRP